MNINTRVMVLAAMFCIEGYASGETASAARTDKAAIRELREVLRADKGRIKRLEIEQHKELVLILEREKSDLKMVKASAAQAETMHLAIIDVHEKSRRERGALRARNHEERSRLRRAIANTRSQIRTLRPKKEGS